MGVLGMIVGATFVLPIDQQGVIRAFWLVAIGFLIAGRWPNGMPPAWQTGEAVPWPSQAELREQRARASQPLPETPAPVPPRRGRSHPGTTSQEAQEALTPPPRPDPLAGSRCPSRLATQSFRRSSGGADVVSFNKAEGSPRAELAEMLALVRESDSVELKLTIPQSNQRATVASLDLDPLEGQIRQVFFFDTPDLILNEAGLVVRARRRQGKADDSVVKLRPVVPDELPKELRASPQLTVEVDAMPGGFVCSATLKARHDEPCVHAAVQRRPPAAQAVHEGQRAFYAEHAPARHRDRRAHGAWARSSC